ncbi:MAG: carboxypeptidase regulatory-like domain-containing protein [Chloroflexi bacterium]|nr:carboxypeptidase regulatory-like domain-containing protein [Chloroflexota bacterium]
MKKNLIFIVLLLFALLALVACGGTVDPAAIATQAADVVSDVQETVAGEGETDQPAPTTESTDQPVSDAPSDRWAGNAAATDMSALGAVTISINGVTAQSDANGAFELSVPRADDSRYVINADKEGYLPISQIHIGSAMESLTLEFQPVETFTINPADGVAVEDSRGTQIDIAPNQLVDENGNPPAGDVSLNMYTYDLENEEMVGDMSGTNSDGEPVYMESEGAFYAEFTDEGGTEYNLADGATAEISIPCEPRPDEVLTVWSYDANTGLWVEEGTATIEGDGSCSAEVSHFSYWNFDYEKRTPSCVKLQVEQSYLDANKPLNVRAVLQTNPTRVIDFTVSDLVNVLINLPNNTEVVFYRAPDYTNAFATANSGAAWGGVGTPAYPYDACQGGVEVAAAPPPAPTTLQGQVTDAVSGSAIANAQVCINGTSLCATTDANGNYTIADAPAGDQVLNVTSGGYITVNDQAVSIAAGATTTQPVALSPELAAGELRIVLTWGTAPSDLDSTLWLPSATRIDYNVKGQTIENVTLDLDDTSGEGPETITISQLAGSGTYTYAVLNFTGNSGGTLSASGAVVRVYRGDQEIGTYTVPTTGDGVWWNVFTLDGVTGAITPVNTLSDTQPVQ